MAETGNGSWKVFAEKKKNMESHPLLCVDIPHRFKTHSNLEMIEKKIYTCHVNLKIYWSIKVSAG